MLRYIVIFFVLLFLELLYFAIADKFNIIDKPNQRSSHSRIVLRGGGIIFLIGAWIWFFVSGFQYPWMLLALTLAAGVSFVDDIHSLPDSVRLAIQFVAMMVMFFELGMLHWDMWWIVLLALIVSVGATNIYNFMDGINGLTAAYSLAVLTPLYFLNGRIGFIEPSFILVSILSVLVFCIFNFRPKNKAKCFAGDVGSIGIAFIILFILGKLILYTGDVTWLVFLILYGVDGCLTIAHRIMLHEHLGEAHRKHAYQILSNELGVSHIVVSSIYMGIQLLVSLAMIYLVPCSPLFHWAYLFVVLLFLSLFYILFMKKYYHLHEEYLASLNN